MSEVKHAGRRREARIVVDPGQRRDVCGTGLDKGIAGEKDDLLPVASWLLGFGWCCLASVGGAVSTGGELAAWVRLLLFGQRRWSRIDRVKLAAGRDRAKTANLASLMNRVPWDLRDVEQIDRC